MAVNKKQKTAIGGVVAALLIAVLGYFGINGFGTPNQFTSPNGQLLTTENLLSNISGQNQTVYVTKTGEKYHLEGCRHLRFRSKIPIEAWQLAEALPRGWEIGPGFLSAQVSGFYSTSGTPDPPTFRLTALRTGASLAMKGSGSER